MSPIAYSLVFIVAAVFIVGGSTICACIIALELGIMQCTKTIRQQAYNSET
jgi:hypothetical protein